MQLSSFVLKVMETFAVATFLLSPGPSTPYCKANGDAEQSRKDYCAARCSGVRQAPATKAALIDLVNSGTTISCLDVKNIENMDELFKDSTEFNDDLSCWDVSAVTSMKSMFYGAVNFDQDISGWDVGSVDGMYGMFRDATKFNQDISRWDVGSVTAMGYMFKGATNFDQDISGWDVGKVISMHFMFSVAAEFNQDISQWDVGSVNNMHGMFQAAYAYNQSLDRWNILKVTGLGNMFLAATKFNQCLGSWPGKAQKDFGDINMFEYSGCEDKSDGLHYCRKQDDTCPLHLDKWELINHRWGANDIHITSLNPLTGLTGFILYEYNKGNSEDVQVQMFPMPDSDSVSCSSGTPYNTGIGKSLKDNSIWGVGNGEKKVYHATKPSDVSSEEHKLKPLVDKEDVAVGKVTFEIDDLFKRSEDGEKQTGKLCIRASYMCGSCFEGATTETDKCCNSCKDVEDAYETKEGLQIADIDDNIRAQCKIPQYISYIDYKLTIDVWKADSGKFSTSTRVEISGTSSVAMKDEVVEEVEVAANLCDGNTGPFKLGQDFSICMSVGAGNALGGEYYIIGFKNVVCKNASHTRELVDESGRVVQSSLTKLNEDADNGNDSYKGFTSVVTAGFVSNGESEETEDSFTCEGGVVLKQKSRRRDLQASEENAEGFFALEIAITSGYNGVDALGSTAPSVVAGPRAIATGAMTVAAALL